MLMLKEKRRLVLVPRETPMSLPDLRNMVACAEAGAMILPAMPAFYQRPATIDDLAAFVAGKSPDELALFGIPRPGHAYWNDVTVDAMAEKYPGLDVSPWRTALVRAPTAT